MTRRTIFARKIAERLLLRSDRHPGTRRQQPGLRRGTHGFAGQFAAAPTQHDNGIGCHSSLTVPAGSAIRAKTAQAELRATNCAARQEPGRHPEPARRQTLGPPKDGHRRSDIPGLSRIGDLAYQRTHVPADSLARRLRLPHQPTQAPADSGTSRPTDRRTGRGRPNRSADPGGTRRGRVTDREPVTQPNYPSSEEYSPRAMAMSAWAQNRWYRNVGAGPVPSRYACTCAQSLSFL